MAVLFCATLKFRARFSYRGGVISPLRSSTVCVASQETAAVVVALEQRRLGHEELSSKSGSVRLKPTCCGAFGLDSRLGHPRAEPALNGRKISITLTDPSARPNRPADSRAQNSRSAWASAALRSTRTSTARASLARGVVHRSGGFLLGIVPPRMCS
jgi:hypothetical protein